VAHRRIVASALVQRHQLSHIGEALFLRLAEEGRQRRSQLGKDLMVKEPLQHRLLAAATGLVVDLLDTQGRVA
jgi:hypothetical protein